MELPEGLSLPLGFSKRKFVWLLVGVKEAEARVGCKVLR